MPTNLPFSLISLLLFLSLVSCSNWQAKGSFTDQNITYIYNQIDTCIANKNSGAILVSDFARIISDALVAAWDPAWNVFVTKLTNYDTDSVVFGYAFRDHWMWLNNYSSDHLSFVIWKDYNCGRYTTFSHSGYGTFDYTFPSETFNAVTNHISGIVNSNAGYYTDPWRFSYDLVVWMNGQYSGAYSAVVYNYNATNFYGKFCNYYASNSDSYTFSFISNGLQSLTYMLFRTR